ncbi:hypothetical protein scyTo_0001377 [Scyliorhinus torazame]|uniref:Uncharacterized protein n=1 Tax=Scyliorhinus torazame TaxID=75743 RepID=A0A401PCG9_SCYTO|nr:hypothetical protein [Scyliorhinus torazame]
MVIENQEEWEKQGCDWSEKKFELFSKWQQGHLIIRERGELTQTNLCLRRHLYHLLLKQPVPEVRDLVAGEEEQRLGVPAQPNLQVKEDFRNQLLTPETLKLKDPQSQSPEEQGARDPRRLLVMPTLDPRHWAKQQAPKAKLTNLAIPHSQ